MTYEEAKALCEANGQSDVLRFYNELSESEKASLLAQIATVDFEELKLATGETKAAPRGHLEPLGAITVEELAAKKEEYETIGLEALKNQKVAAVLLAGGQGTRLGFDKAKGMFNVGIHKELYIFECLIRNVIQVTDRIGTWIPFYIMTSDKNHEDTVNFFAEHNYFGYDPSYIRFFKQRMAPSVDFDGKLYLEEKGKLSLSPNGNGGWFTSMQAAGIVEDAKKRGVEWLNIFAVDNVLQKIADPTFVGAVLREGYVSGAKVVRKNDPEERVGVMCLEDGRPSIVEYYEMTPEMITLRDEKGNLSYAYGVILNYLFSLEELERIAGETLSTHIVKKKIPYVDAVGNPVAPTEPNGYKFETLILDMIHLFQNCLPVEVVREKEFAPIKNPTGVDSLESARELMKKNGIEF